MIAAASTSGPATLGAIASIFAACVSVFITFKVKEVHLLVNSQLKAVMDKLEKVTAERDWLDPDKPGGRPDPDKPAGP